MPEDDQEFRVFTLGEARSLIPTLRRLLARMARAPRRAFARAELLESGHSDRASLDRVVDSHMSHLRRKLTEAGASGLLIAVRGLGYRLMPDP